MSVERLYRCANGTSVFKVFSRAPLGDAALRALFVVGERARVECDDAAAAPAPRILWQVRWSLRRALGFDSRRRTKRGWLAYPRLVPRASLDECGPFELERGLFDLSAIECVISTMETATVAARNAARLVRARLLADARRAHAGE